MRTPFFLMMSLRTQVFTAWTMVSLMNSSATSLRNYCQFAIFYAGSPFLDERRNHSLGEFRHSLADSTDCDFFAVDCRGRGDAGDERVTTIGINVQLNGLVESMFAAVVPISRRMFGTLTLIINHEIVRAVTN